MGPIYVTWRGGTWWLVSKSIHNPIEAIEPTSQALDNWLAAHGATRSDLAFSGSRPLERKFIDTFGPFTDDGASSNEQAG
jgi:hypothetical protein